MVFITSVMLDANNAAININGIQPDIMIGNTEDFT